MKQKRKEWGKSDKISKEKEDEREVAGGKDSKGKTMVVDARGKKRRMDVSKDKLEKAVEVVTRKILIKVLEQQQ